MVVIVAIAAIAVRDAIAAPGLTDVTNATNATNPTDPTDNGKLHGNCVTLNRYLLRCFRPGPPDRIHISRTPTQRFWTDMLKLVLLVFLVGTMALTHAPALAVEIPPDARSMALQGGRAAPYDNGSLYINPAGAALLPRYEVAAFGRYAEDAPRYDFNLSIVDSLTVGEMGGGMSWRRQTGQQRPQDDFVLALAQDYGGTSAVGIGLRYRLQREPEDLRHFNFDIGTVYDELDGLFKVAVVASNLLNTPEGIPDMERNFSVGLASGWPGMFEVTVDGIWTPSAPSAQQLSWSTGLEIFIGEYVQVRGGYGQFPGGPDRQGRWSVGLAGGEPGVWNLGYVFLKPTGSEPGTHGATLAGFAFN